MSLRISSGPVVPAADIEPSARADRLRVGRHEHPARSPAFLNIERTVRPRRVSAPGPGPASAPVRTVRPAIRRSPRSIAIHRPRHPRATLMDHPRAVIHQVNLPPGTVEHERRKRTWPGRRSDHPGTLFGKIPMPCGIGPCGRRPTRGLRGYDPRQQEKKNPRPHALTLRRCGRTVNAR